MRTRHFIAAFAALSLLPLAAPAAGKTVKPTKVLITGLVDGEGLDRLIPAGGFITRKEDFEKLWQAWLLECQVPAVDFKTSLVVVATSRDGPIEAATLVEGKKAGEMEVEVKLERKTQASGFFTLIAVFPRAGVKKIGGKAVPEKARP